MDQIMTARESMVPELKQLWHSVFGDTKEYIDFYYEHAFPLGRTLVYSKAGCICGMLTMLTAKVSDGSVDEQADYIYAVATDPRYRRQGIAGSLLKRAEEISRMEGRKGTFLVPATEELFQFYEKYGYHSTIFRSKEAFEIFCEEEEDCEVRIEVLKVEEYECYRREAAGTSPFIYWDTDWLSYMLKEYLLCGGKAVKVMTAEESGAILYHLEEETLVIRETTLSETGTRAFAHFLLHLEHYTKVRSYSFLTDGSEETKQPFGMTNFDTEGQEYYFNLALD